MRFILRGFLPDAAFRVFTFEGVDDDNSHKDFSVRADLTLARRYGIRLQDLPLLCHGLLERREDVDQTRDLTFGEAEMCRHQSDSAATQLAAAHKRRPSRRPPTENAGSAWRTSSPGTYPGA